MLLVLIIVSHIYTPLPHFNKLCLSVLLTICYSAAHARHVYNSSDNSGPNKFDNYDVLAFLTDFAIPVIVAAGGCDLSCERSMPYARLAEPSLVYG